MFEEASGVIELGPSPVWNWLLRSRVIYISTKLYNIHHPAPRPRTCEHAVIYLLTEVLRHTGLRRVAIVITFYHIAELNSPHRRCAPPVLQELDLLRFHFCSVSSELHFKYIHD